MISPALLLGQGIQPVQDVVGEPWKGAPAVRESVEEIMARQARVDVEGRRPSPVERKRFEEVRPSKRPRPGAPTISRWPPAPRTMQRATTPFSPQIIGSNFLGVDFAEGPAVVPPDSMGAVGPTQVVVATNGRIKAFDKVTGFASLDVDLDVFFASLLGSLFSSDPHVRFDRLSQRWFVTAISIRGMDPEPPNNILIAVSSGPTINNTASFSFFKFRHDQVGLKPNADTGGVADYDTLGVDRFALYIGVSVFKTTTITSTVFVVRKSDLLAGGLTVTPFRQLGIFDVSTNPPTGSGMDTPQGVDNDDPNSIEGYFIGVDMVQFSVLNMRRISNPGGAPAISVNIALPVASTAFPLDQAQPTPGKPLDALSDRLFAAAIHQNKITGASTLWTAQSIEVDASGIGVFGGGRNGARWYEITSLTTFPTVNQFGTLFDPAGTNPFGYWMPSVAMSGQGHMALGASRASSNDPQGRAGVAVAGRFADDPLGGTQADSLAQAGLAIYSFFTSASEQRWGDYSQTVVDPSDDMTIWTFQEFSNASGDWSVRAVQLLAPPPATPISANPSVVSPGQTGVNVTITGSAISGSGFFDPGPDAGGPGFANHISALVSPGVTVNSVSFANPTTVTLSISTAASLGQKNVTITNPDGQSSSGFGVLSVLASTTTSLVSSSNPSFINQAITFTASVASPGGFGTPTGTVTFLDGVTLLGSVALSNGQATLMVSSLTVGSHTITAQYGGDSGHAVSASPAIQQAVSLFHASSSISSNLNPSFKGNSVTFSTTVTGSPGGGTTPAGTVTFKDGATVLGTRTLNGSSRATFSTSALSVGSHFITVSYGGDATHNPSTSPTLHQLVQVLGIGLAVTNSPDPVIIGKIVTITTTVTNIGANTATYNFSQSFIGSFNLVSASSSPTVGCSGSGSVTCSIPAGSSATITTVVRALFGHTLAATSTVTSGTNTGTITDLVRVRFRPFHF